MIIHLEIDQMDVEMAFMESILEEHEYVYLKCPHGLVIKEDECLEVHK